MISDQIALHSVHILVLFLKFLFLVYVFNFSFNSLLNFRQAGKQLNVESCDTDSEQRVVPLSLTPPSKENREKN